jgi:hypothetical protein
MQIDVYMDHVVIEGQVVQRPSYISRSKWMSFWGHRK